MFNIDAELRAAQQHSACRINAATRRWCKQKNVKRVPYSTLPIFFTAATRRALS